MNPYRGSSSSHSRLGGEGYRERTMNNSNMSRDDHRRKEMETRAQDWEREEQPAYPSRHYDKHYMDDPDRNLQNLMRNDMNRKSRFNNPREQERGFDQDYRNEHGNSSFDRDERRQAYEREEMNRHKVHNKSSSRWEPKSNTLTDPRLDPRRSQPIDSFRQPNSESRTNPWREDYQDNQPPKDPRWQGANTSTKNFLQPDRSSNMNDKDMRLPPSAMQVSGPGKQKYEMARPPPPPPNQITDITRSVPSPLPTVTLQGKQKPDRVPSPFNESRNHSSIPSQMPHSSHMPTGRQPSVPASHSHPHTQPFGKVLSKSGQQMPPYRSDHLQPKERSVSPHMSPAHLSSRESSFSPPPTSGDVDMRLGAPKSVPLSAVSKTDLSLIRKALASLKTVKTNKEQPTESTKSKIVEDEYDPEAEWKTSQGTSKESKKNASDNIISKDLQQKEKLVKHNLMAQGSPPLPPTLPLQPPTKSISPSLPLEPTTFFVPPPPSKPPTFSNMPLVPTSETHTINSLKKDSVPLIKSMPTSSLQSIQHSKSKDSDPAIDNANKSDKKNTKFEKTDPSKTVSSNKDQMLEYLNIGLPPSKKPSQSVIPGSLGDLLLKAKNKGVSKDQPSEIVEKSAVRSDETVSSKDADNQNIKDVSSTENKNNNINDRKDQSNTPNFQHYIETSKIQDSKLSVGETLLERTLHKKSNYDMNSKMNISGFEKNLSQETSHTTKSIPLQKSVGLSQYEKSRLFGHRNTASPPPAESQTKVPILSSDQDDFTSEPMVIDEDDSNYTVSQARDPRMRKDENASNVQSQDPRILARSSGDPRNRDPRMMTQKDARMDNQESHKDFTPVNDPRRISSSFRDPRQAQNFGNRDPRSQRTDPRLITQADVIPPTPRYESDTPIAHKFSPHVPPPGFNPSLPPPNFSSSIKSYSGPDHRLPPPMASYGSNNNPKPNRPNMAMSHPNKGQYTKDPRIFSNPQVRHSYNPAASRSNWPQQQFPVAGGVGINRSFFPQRSDVPSPGPPQSPPMHSQVNDSVDVDYAFTCLMMKGLPFFANSRYIYHFFEEFLLLDQIIEVDYKYQCKGNAYIRFSSNPVAKHAFKNLNGWLMNGHQIILKPLSIGFFNQAKNTYKAKSTEREANLGLPEMPRGNANPYYKQQPQKPPSPPPPSVPEPPVLSTQESSVSSTGHNAQDDRKEESNIKYHAEYKDPHKKIDKSFKVPKIKKNYDSSVDLPKEVKLKKEGLLKKHKEKVLENKSKKHDVSSKEKKKKYKKVIIESETSSSEEEYEVSESGSTIDESDDNEDKLVKKNYSKMKEKVLKESKVSKAVKINKPMPKSVKEKLKLRNNKSNSSEKGTQDRISIKKEKEVNGKINLVGQKQTDSADEIKNTSNEPLSDSSSESEEKGLKESNEGIKCESPINDEGVDEVQDESNVQEDSEETTMNILPNTTKEKKKVLNKKSSITHSKVKRMKQNALPSKKKITIKNKKALVTQINDPTMTSKLDLSEIFNIVLAQDYVPESKITIPVPKEYLKEHELNQEHACFVTLSKVNKIKQKSVPSKKKSVIKKNKAKLEKSKESEVVSNLDLREVFEIVLAPDYIPEHNCVSDIPDEFLQEVEIVSEKTLKPVKKKKPVSKKKKKLVTDESLPENTSKPVKKTKPVSKKRKKVVKVNSKPEKVLKKRKTRAKPGVVIEPEKPVVPQSSWRSQKLTMTEEYGRKKVRVTIPLPQRMMIQLPEYDKTAMIKMRTTKTLLKKKISTSEEMDLEETYAQDGFYSVSMEEDSEDIEPQENIMEDDSEFTESYENSMEVDSQDVGPK